MKRLGLRYGVALLLIFFIVSTPLFVGIIKSDPSLPKIYIDPPQTTANPYETFSINIMIADVTNLYSWGVWLRWNNTRMVGKLALEATKIEEGEFLKRGDYSTIFPPPTPNNIEGKVYVSCTRFGPVPGETGSGTLATITFKVKEGGNCTLHLYDTKLHEAVSGLPEIPHTVEDGYFSTTVPFAYFICYYSPEPLAVNQTITFDATKSYDPDGGTITDYDWDFDDGNIANDTGPIVNHIYTTKGSHYPKLYVTDNEGKLWVCENLVSAVIRDIAITSVTVSPTTVMPEGLVNINVTVTNKGELQETFNVTVYYDGVSIGTQENINLQTPTISPYVVTKNLTFPWEPPTGTSSGTYKIKAVAEVGFDSNTTNNVFVDGDATLIRDIAVTEITVFPKTAIAGTIVDVNVTVANLGFGTQSFNVTAYYSNATLTKAIGTQTVTNLASKSTTPLTFNWNTTGLSLDIYTIKANATVLPEEYNSINNELTDGTVTIAPWNIYYREEPVGDPPEYFYVSIMSNSTVSSITFNLAQKEISFNVGGLSGIYFCNVSIPKGLLDAPPDGWSVLIDGIPATPIVTYNATHSFVYFTYTLSTRKVQIKGATAANPPVASFTFTPEKPYTGESVTFDASASYDPDGSITSYEWDFGDGATGIGKTISHIYTPSENKTYTVTLIVTDNHTPALKDTSKMSVPITALKPVAKFTSSKTMAFAGEPITFDASSSYDPDGGSILSYKWNFRDGNITTVSVPTIIHIYTDGGPTWTNYNVTLTVTDDDCLNATTYKSIRIFNVYDIAITDLTVSPATVNIGEIAVINVTITNVSEKTATMDNVNVTVYFDGTIIETPKTVPNLVKGSSKTVVFNWTTSHVPLGTHKIKAEVNVTLLRGLSDFPDEPNKENNIKYYDVTVQKWTSVLSISASSLNFTVGESTLINGSISPKRVGAEVKIWYRSGSETWTLLKTELTNATSEYSYPWTPETAGTYELKANWTGDDSTLPDESELTPPINVGKMSSTISLDISSSSVIVGSGVTISGEISPARAGVNVTIQYSRDGGAWTTLTTVSTDSNGHYSHSWAPSEVGTYQLKASWAGDANTFGDESETKPLTVEAAPINILLYVAVGAGIAIVLIMLAVYFLRRPKIEVKT